METYRFRSGRTPLLVSMPHTGTHVPEWLAPRLEEVHALIRSHVSFYDHDRYFAPDITAIQALVESGEFHPFVPGLLPSRL